MTLPPGTRVELRQEFRYLWPRTPFRLGKVVAVGRLTAGTRWVQWERGRKFPEAINVKFLQEAESHVGA